MLPICSTFPKIPKSPHVALLAFPISLQSTEWAGFPYFTRKDTNTSHKGFAQRLLPKIRGREEPRLVLLGPVKEIGGGQGAGRTELFRGPIFWEEG